MRLKRHRSGLRGPSAAAGGHRPAGPHRPRGGRLLRAPLRVAYDVGAILVEVLRIPLRVCLRAAGAAGAAVLAVWRVAWPAAIAVGHGWRRLLAAAARAATPARAVLAVSLVAIGALVASQFVDYRAVEIGAPQYHAVAGVAPPPRVDLATARSAHGAWMIAIAGAALAVLAIAAASGRWRPVRLLLPLGAAVVVIAIAVDAPKGLEKGQAAISYQGARAILLEGFGAEIAAGCVLGLSGLLLASYASAGARRGVRRRGEWDRRPAPAPGRRRIRRPDPRKASG